MRNCFLPRWALAVLGGVVLLASIRTLQFVLRPVVVDSCDHGGMGDGPAGQPAGGSRGASDCCGATEVCLSAVKHGTFEPVDANASGSFGCARAGPIEAPPCVWYHASGTRRSPTGASDRTCALHNR